MKRRLLLITLLGTLGVNAQTTHFVSWRMGVTSAEATMTIDAGDIVTWTWDDNLPHSVTSQAGGAETFDSGTLTGNTNEFSHTFTAEGTTSYRCNVHGAMMQGAITAEAVMGIEDSEDAEFAVFPNPATDVVTINAKDVIDRVEVYDLNGRMVMGANASTPSARVYMSNYSAGTYIVKISSGEKTKSVRILKK